MRRHFFVALTLFALVAGIAIATGQAGKAPVTGMTAAPSKISFGRVPVDTTSSPVTVTITNNTSETVYQSGFSSDLGGTDSWGAFSAGSGTCLSAVYLAVGDTCTVHVVFHPTDSGRVADTLTLGFSGYVTPFNDYGSKFNANGSGYHPNKPTPF